MNPRSTGPAGTTGVPAAVGRRSSPLLAALVVVALASVAPGATADVATAVVTLLAMGLTVSGARRLRGSTGWQIITAGAVLMGLSPAFSELHRALGDPDSVLTLGDGVLLVGYLGFIVGLQRVLSVRTIALQVRAVLDSALAVLWIAYVVLLITGPRLTDHLDGVELAAALLFLPFTLALVFLLLQLVLGSVSRSPSIWMVTAGTASTVVSELAFLGAAAGTDWLRRLGIAAATTGLVALAGAVRHPSAADFELPTAGLQEPLSTRRAVYYVASFVAVVAAAALPAHSYLLVLLGAIVIASTTNLFVLIRERERLLVVERQLRVSVAEIMRAADDERILDTGCLAIDRLLGHKVDQYCEFVTPAAGGWITVPHGLRVAGDPAVLDALGRAEATGALVRDEHPTEDGGTYRTRLVVPLEEIGEARALLVEATPVLTTSEIEQVEQVTTAVQRALEAHGLQEERHQHRADRRFRALVQDSGDVVALINAETLAVTMVSPSMQRILGHIEDGVLGADAVRHVHPSDRDAVRDQLANAVVRPQSAAADVRVRHADGHYHWFSATVRDLTSDQEIGGLVLNLTDIHDRKMAELSLSFSEQRYRAMVLNSKDVFAVLEHDLTISYVSANVEQVLSFRAQDLVASKISSLLTDDSAERLIEFIAESREALRNDVVELELRTPGRRNRIGEVTISSRQDGLSQGYTVSIRDITEQRRLERTLRDQALYDRMTGLANRSTLHFELQQRLQSLRSTEYLGLIHIDINDFRTVNESVGYEAGDDLLVEVAARLRSSLRTSDILARVGGNEFAIAVVTDSEGEVVRFAQRVEQLFHEPFEIAGRSQRLAVSIGVHVTGDRRSIARSLLDAASLALGAARTSTQERVRVYEPSLRTSATERFELGADLGGAIGRDELSVVYQPIVEIDTRKVRGVEALLRWTHPQRGPISPGVFIPLAEKSGLVVELGRWVMGQACRQLRTWHETVPGADNLTMSVNVSALQLERTGEAATLADIVVRSGVEAHRVTAELTESTLIEDAEWIRSQLEILRELGMRVAVDDFGTGAAGLSHLRDVPFNVIKIDKSYVDALSRSEEATNLVRGVIALAHSLGAETVAEGIENNGEFELLQQLGCELGQGFYLARPMDPAQLEEWFALGRTGAVPALIARVDNG